MMRAVAEYACENADHEPSWHETEFGFTFHWDVRKLWEIDLPVVPMQVQELEWMLDKPFWSEGSTVRGITARDVAGAPDRYREHYERAMVADLTCPINVIWLGGRWVIMDGVHRLLKAWLRGHETILTKQAFESDVPRFSRRPTDPHNHPEWRSPRGGDGG